MQRIWTVAGRTFAVVATVTGILVWLVVALAGMSSAHGRYELACYATHGHYPVSCHSSIPHKLACVDVVRDTYVPMRHCR